jgi:hypothetical protein
MTDVWDSAGVTADGVDDAELVAAIEQNPGWRTEFPELSTYLDRPDRATHTDANSEALEEKASHEGVRVRFYSSDGDPMAAPRQQLVLHALSILRAGGYELPPTLDVALPRYHRSLVVRRAADGSEGRVIAISVEAVSDLLPDDAVASFFAPDQMFVSLRAAANRSAGPTDQGAYSIPGQMHDTGLGAVLHEMMHWLHFQQWPSRYVDLTWASFGAADTTRVGEVSPYSGENSQEFVAEYGLGRLLSRSYEPPDRCPTRSALRSLRG